MERILDKRIHFIGIGGIGMSGIAQLCLRKGYIVSGSDIYESDNLKKLRELGADIYIGHNRAHVKDKDLVVYSSAITTDNSELKEAVKQKTPVLKRAQLLASLMNNQTVIVITGAHGKTTTSSLSAHLFNEAALSPTIAVGGIVGNLSDNAKLGNGQYFIAEADESDGTFLFYRPKYSIVTNIDHEHLDFYKSFENLKKSFRRFMLNNSKDGCIFWCRDDIELENLIKGLDRRNISYGLSNKADIYAANIELCYLSSHFDVFCNNKFVERFKLSIPGRHNISNSLAVIGLGLELKLEIELIKKALNSFLGVRRRFQIKHNQNDIMVVDDYAHHPTEIAATIEIAKRVGKKRIVAVFQPHRYTRMKLLMKKFSQCFFQADQVFITDIYSAGEEKIEGVDSRGLYKLMRDLSLPKVNYAEKPLLTKSLLDFVKQGDLLLFLGAGDINKISDEFVKELTRKVNI